MRSRDSHIKPAVFIPGSLAAEAKRRCGTVTELYPPKLRIDPSIHVWDIERNRVEPAQFVHADRDRDETNRFHRGILNALCLLGAAAMVYQFLFIVLSIGK
jgi:hypothetical protein